MIPVKACPRWRARARSWAGSARATASQSRTALSLPPGLTSRLPYPEVAMPDRGLVVPQVRFGQEPVPPLGQALVFSGGQPVPQQRVGVLPEAGPVPPDVIRAGQARQTMRINPVQGSEKGSQLA